MAIEIPSTTIDKFILKFALLGDTITKEEANFSSCTFSPPRQFNSSEQPSSFFIFPVSLSLEGILYSRPSFSSSSLGSCSRFSSFSVYSRDLNFIWEASIISCRARVLHEIVNTSESRCSGNLCAIVLRTAGGPSFFASLS